MRKFGDDTTRPGQWILLEDFITHIKKQHNELDVLKSVRKPNVIRELSNYKDGLTEVDNQQYVSTLAVLRFVFNHVENLHFCMSICQELA